MESTVNFTVTPFQALLAFAFQLWMIIFPVMLIRKINYLTALVQDHLQEHEENS